MILSATVHKTFTAMTSSFFAYVLIHVILTYMTACFGYKIKCPVSQQWKLRSILNCRHTEEYICLYNTVYLKFMEGCFGPKEESGGGYIVLNINGNLDVKDCKMNHYQPLTYNYKTTQGSDCLYIKSGCSEEGQVIHSNGSLTTDRTCRCDYTKGYAFISANRMDPCSCTPSLEDCSCYITTCPNRKVLSPDYTCTSDMLLQDQYHCPVLPVSVLKYPAEEKRPDSVTVLNEIIGNSKRSDAIFAITSLMLTWITVFSTLLVFISKTSFRTIFTDVYEISGRC